MHSLGVQFLSLYMCDFYCYHHVISEKQGLILCGKSVNLLGHRLQGALDVLLVVKVSDFSNKVSLLAVACIH